MPGARPGGDRRGPEHYTVADRPTTPPSVVIHPGGRCTSEDDGRPLAEEWSLGVRTWGHDADGECVLLVGTYEGHSRTSEPLLSALPPVVMLARQEVGAALLDVLAAAGSRPPSPSLLPPPPPPLPWGSPGPRSAGGSPRCSGSRR